MPNQGLNISRQLLIIIIDTTKMRVFFLLFITFDDHKNHFQWIGNIDGIELPFKSLKIGNFNLKFEILKPKKKESNTNISLLLSIRVKSILLTVYLITWIQIKWDCIQKSFSECHQTAPTTKMNE